MCEIARHLEHLIALCELRNTSSKSEARELSTPRVWIEESCDLVSWKSKPCFFSFYKREKPKFWGAIVGSEVQNSYILGLGFTRVQIDKYWILILIQEPELLRRENERLKTTKIYPLKSWVWEITGKLSEEIFLRGFIEYGSIVYSNHYNGPPQSSHHVEMPHRHTGKKEDSKISMEKFYLHIKCIVPTFMVVFMWSRPLNNVS